MRAMVMVVVASAVLSACSETTVMEPMAPQFAKPQATGGVTATLLVGGAVVYRESGPANTGEGVCEAGGSWRNTAAGYVTEAAHPNCAGVVGGDPIRLEVGGRMSGGTLRNPGWWLGYQAGKDNTWGSGSATVADGSGRSWWLFFGQEMLQARGNIMSSGGTVALLCSDLGCHPGLLSW